MATSEYKTTNNNFEPDLIFSINLSMTEEKYGEKCQLLRDIHDLCRDFKNPTVFIYQINYFFTIIGTHGSQLVKYEN